MRLKTLSFLRGGLLPILFLLVALPTCLVFVHQVPPGQVADEPAHIVRADSLLKGEWVGHSGPQPQPDGAIATVAGVDADTSYLWVTSLAPPHTQPVDPVRLARARTMDWTGVQDFVGVNTIATYMPIFYAPSALGLAVARQGGEGPFQAILVGRMANTLAYLALATAALALARRGRGLLFCMLAVPMALSLAASFNQDCLIIAASALAAALITRCDDGRRSPAYWAAAVLLALVIMVKPPYLPLAALLLLPLPAAWADVLRAGPARARLLGRVAVMVVVALPALAWTVFIQRGVALPVPRLAYEAGILWPGPRPAVFHGTDTAAQLHVLLAAPWRMLTLVWHTLRVPGHFRGLFLESIGVLGWLDLRLPKAVYGAWTLALLAAAWADIRLRAGAGARRVACAAWARVRWTEVALMVFAAWAAVEGIFLSQYLTWTSVGMPAVDGPQGRYFLPLFPLFILALPRPAQAGPGEGVVQPPHPLAWLAPALAATVTLALLPGALTGAYYSG